MAHTRSLALLLMSSALTIGCSDTEGAGGSQAGALPCAVEELLRDRCWSCHAAAPLYGAPMPLLEATDFAAAGRDGRPISELVSERLRDDASPMPPASEERLSDAETATLEAWFADDMPSGEGAECGDGAGGSPPAQLSCTPDVLVTKAAPYTMSPGAEDETKCFGFELENAGAKRHITALGPSLGNPGIVHHFLLFQAPEAQGDEPFDCSLFPPKWKLLYAWAPGAPPYELPEAAGFPLRAGETAHLVLQMHYNNFADVPDPTDDTGVELCTTEELRENDAGVMSFGGSSFEIPANGSATMTCEFDVPEQTDGALPVHVFQAWPHMHQLGRSMKTVIYKPNGDAETLVDVDGFSFASQLLYPTDVDLEPGDRVVTTCGWANPTSEPVGYGETSDQEMCFDIVTYYPAITVPGFSGGLPAAVASCETD